MSKVYNTKYSEAIWEIRGYLYKLVSKNGEVVVYDGIEQNRGLRCHKLRYSYPHNITTTRYFAVNDHTLVSSLTDKGVESVEISANYNKQNI